MRSNSPVSFLLAAATLSVMSLVGCSANDEPAVDSGGATVQDAPRVEAGKSAAVPAPAEELSPIVLPECDTANPLAAEEGAVFFASQGIDISTETGPTDMEAFTRLSGPSAQAAMDGASQIRACRWPLYIAGNDMKQYSAIIEADTRDTLVQSLRESDFIESPLGRATVFTHSVDDPTNYRMSGPTTIQYLFVENVWMAIFETGKSNYAQSSLDALYAINPALLSEPWH